MRKAYEKAEENLKKNWNNLIHEDLIPTDNIPEGEKTIEPMRYGVSKWNGLFNARQLLVHAEIVRLIRDIRYRVIEDELRKGRNKEEAENYSKAITTYLTLAFGKTCDYNSILTSWAPSQGSIDHVFETHSFAWTWDFGEIGVMTDDASPAWAIRNVLKSLKGIIKRIEQNNERIKVLYGDATKTPFYSNNLYDVIITDPPYYDNVQYGELSDYFYMWFKKILRDIYPEAFGGSDTPKQDEAVANRVRHGNSALSTKFYENKMRDIFTSMHKTLRDDGVFAVWFAHKSGAAWTSTIHALLSSGFTITALWGVRTEMEISLHISGKAALRTNIILICRKSLGTGSYIQDVLSELEKRIEPRLAEIENYGFLGPDFIMSAQAEALKAASRCWPLKDPEGKQTPMEMLDLVTDQAVGFAVNYITQKIAPQIVSVDAPTKFYVLSRYLFGDSIPYDDARRLALACLGVTGIGDPVTEIAVNTGLGELTAEYLDGEKAKVLELANPWDRVRKGRINTTESAPIIDWIHQAVALLEEGKSVNQAAEAIAQAGGAACDVLSALYQILPDQITQGRRTTPNPEKAHVQTLLLTVCQEGLHLIARARLREERAQKRITDYPTAKSDSAKYDPVLDAFIKGADDYVEVSIEGADPKTLHEALKERIASRNLTNKIKTHLTDGTVYLERKRR
jgi:hypothetical protein